MHEFRDAADAHFIDWRSKKIALDLAKGHPTKLQINKFVAPAAAVAKMREMLDRIKLVTELAEPPIPHHYSSLTCTDRQLAVTLTPSNKGQKVRHPSDKDWERLTQRFQHSVADSGRSGTYRAKSAKPRAVGARDFRVDKYGRRIE